MKYPDMDWGKMEKVVDRLGGMNGVIKFLGSGGVADYKKLEKFVSSDGVLYLNDFLKLVGAWYRYDGIVYINDPFISDGTSGSEWVNRFHKGGKRISDDGIKILESDDFQPLRPGTKTYVVILKGDLEYSNTEKILEKAANLGFLRPHPEIACRIRERFPDKEDLRSMGFWGITTMHKPISNRASVPSFLYATALGDGQSLMASTSHEYSCEDGFAFALPQASA